MTLVTQFFFEHKPFLHWVGERAQGVGARLVGGVAGPARTATLLKFAMRCGVGPSIRALSVHPSTFMRLIGDHGPNTSYAGWRKRAAPGPPISAASTCSASGDISARASGCTASQPATSPEQPWRVRRRRRARCVTSVRKSRHPRSRRRLIGLRNVVDGIQASSRSTRVNSGIRGSHSSNRMRTAIRATMAPRQPWTPPPNPR